MVTFEFGQEDWGIAEWGVRLGYATVEVAGRVVVGAMREVREVGHGRSAGGVEWAEWEGDVAGEPGLRVRLEARWGDTGAGGVVRMRWTWVSQGVRRLTKVGGSDQAGYLSLRGAALGRVWEVGLSDFVELSHSYTLMERELSAEEMAVGAEVMGPLLVVEREGGGVVVMGYEHGSQHPDCFVRFAVGSGGVELGAVKGNYLAGQDISSSPFVSPWLHVGVGEGLGEVARRYRRFMLREQSENAESRKPYIYYNSWNHQERIHDWQGRPYLDDMRQERIEREVEVAGRIGVDTFVIDTGWYQKTGDWEVNRERFPDGLAKISGMLRERGMRLGLWFDNAAALSSRMFAEHGDCVMGVGGKRGEPSPIWETEASHRLCPVSRWWSAFADELIRLHGETGVTYFKLDAIQQMNVWAAVPHYCCDEPGHDHGDASHTAAERGERFAYLLPLYMAKIAERVREKVPGSILDFDMTEGGRCFGLSFLSAGKFFLINNGPYFWSYNIPKPEKYSPNLLFYPGPARSANARTTCGFDKWLPLTTMLTHYLPDDGENFQTDTLASLMLGHGGIWGDLCGISADGVERLGGWLRKYKVVRDAVASACPVVTGRAGGTPEIHEKLFEGRGVVCLFAQTPTEVKYVSRSAAAGKWSATAGVEVSQRGDGRAEVLARFAKGETAKFVLFGV